MCLLKQFVDLFILFHDRYCRRAISREKEGNSDVRFYFLSIRGVFDGFYVLNQIN